MKETQMHQDLCDTAVYKQLKQQLWQEMEKNDNDTDNADYYYYHCTLTRNENCIEYWTKRDKTAKGTEMMIMMMAATREEKAPSLLLMSQKIATARSLG